MEMDGAEDSQHGARFYENLTAWQRVQIAKVYVQRPFALDYIARCFTQCGIPKSHGDRVFGDDKAMPCGLAKLGAQRCVLRDIARKQKGRDTKENVKRNFGCAYRKAIAKLFA